MGTAVNHKDLVIGYEKVHGGGWWERDDNRKTITLYGSSGDYGDPKFRCLKRIPSEFRGYTFIYTPIHGLPGNPLELTDIEWI